MIVEKFFFNTVFCNALDPNQTQSAAGTLLPPPVLPPNDSTEGCCAAGFIDSKLRGCDVIALKVENVAPGGYAVDRATVLQKKTGQPVRSN